MNEAVLPTWNLDDLYAGPEADDLNADLDAAEAAAKAFQTRYAGKLAGLDGAGLGAAIAAYEALIEPLHKAASYAQLLHAGDVSDGEISRFHQSLQERVTDISTATLFFSLELNRIDDDVLAGQMEHADAARYAPWVREVRAFRDHQLSDEVEKLLHEKAVAGRNAWMRLFDETLADMRFSIDGEEKTLGDTLDMLTDRDGDVRKTGAKALGAGLAGNARTLALVTNTLAKDKAIEDAWRSHAKPWSSRNLANQVEDEVMEALVEAVKGAYARTSHRYYALKAEWMGADKLDYWDRNAPLPDDADRPFTWDEAKSTVLDAYGSFDGSMAETAERFFDERWIDVPPRPGKNPGAFAHPVVPSAHPYILVNFRGKTRDVMTLAHELGHGVHQVLAGPQGALMCGTPLTLAETASVFGEMLTFRSILDAEDDPVRRRVLLAGKVEDMLNTVVRQVAFHEFERHVHTERVAGELSVERLGDIWMQVQEESLGPALRFDDDYRSYWGYIPHFIHAPFYVYAYAFGDCLVNSLYGVFAGGHEGFQAKYLDMLRAGGTLRHKELLAPFGLDATDPAFWGTGLDVIAGFIDELEAAA